MITSLNGYEETKKYHADQKNRTEYQISVMSHNASGAPFPDVSIEVADVDEVHARAAEQDIEIVYPLTDEPWGVRRFFVLDPNGTVINILSHL